MVRIKCVKLDKCPICGDKGSCQVLAIGKQGNVRTKTLKVFNEDEMKKIIERNP